MGFFNPFRGSGTGGSGGSGTGKIKSPIVSGINLGDVTIGQTYPAGTDIEEILRDILKSYSPPQVTLKISPSTEIYNVVEETLSSVTLNATVLKKTNAVSNVKFYVDNVLVNEITQDVENGGSFSFMHKPATPINKTTIFKVTASDGEAESTSTKKITFTGLSYYGTVAESITIPTENDIINLQNNVLKDTAALIYSPISVSYGKVLYAYPKELGELKQIVDAYGFDYTNSYNHGEVVVNGIDYLYYILIDAVGTDDGYQKFI